MGLCDRGWIPAICSTPVPAKAPGLPSRRGIEASAAEALLVWGILLACLCADQMIKGCSDAKVCVLNQSIHERGNGRDVLLVLGSK